MELRNLQKEIEDLEKAEGFKLLDIETMDGVLSGNMVETAFDLLKDTLKSIDLDKIAGSVEKNIKVFAEHG